MSYKLQYYIGLFDVAVIEAALNVNEFHDIIDFQFTVGLISVCCSLWQNG
jgi:hypothetical protein